MRLRLLLLNLPNEFGFEQIPFASSGWFRSRPAGPSRWFSEYVCASG